VRFVLLLAWETLLPTCRPLPVSSQTRDMVSILIFGRASRRPEERRPLAARARFVNAASHQRQQPNSNIRVDDP
jgi:hypothetical protein